MAAPFPLPSYPPAYAPLARFVAPARARAEYWRIGATLALTILGFIILTEILQSLVARIASILMGPVWTEAVITAIFASRAPIAMIAVLAGFVPLALALAIAVRALHDRSWGTLFGPLRLTRQTFLWTGGAVVVLQLVLLPVQVFSPDVGRHLTLAQQLPWIVPALLFIVLQSATEEALFRGYLVQQLAVRHGSPLVWMGVPALLFAALHLDPTAGTADMLWSAGSAFLFSLMAADLTARCGTLGPAVGVHAAINIGSILMVGLYGRMDGLAAWNLVLNPMQPWAALPYMATDLLGLLVVWLLARLILRV